MRISVVSLAFTYAVVIACGDDRKVPALDASLPPRAALERLAMDLDDFRGLRFLEGHWRGTMPDGKSFYEQYRFIDDSTIVKYGYPDSTFAKPSDSSRVQLRAGTVADESVGSRYVATRLDSTGADFAPERGATNYYTWAPESPITWNATLRWTDKNGRPQSVVYALHKFAR